MDARTLPAIDIASGRTLAGWRTTHTPICFIIIYDYRPHLTLLTLFTILSKAYSTHIAKLIVYLDLALMSYL